MRTAISRLNHDPRQQELSSDPDNELAFHGTFLRDILLRTFGGKKDKDGHVHAHVALQAPDDVSYPGHSQLDHPHHQDTTLVPSLNENHAGKREALFTGVFSEDLRIQSWARRYSHANPVRVEGDPVLDGLNSTQIMAMAMMIGERMSLIQGVYIHLSPVFTAELMTPL